MDPLQYCRDRVLVTGSPLRLTHLFVGREAAQKLICISALIADIGNIPYQVADPSVARTKLAWWLQELQRFQAAEARHPITQAMQALKLENLPKSDFEAWVDALAGLIDPPPLENGAQLMRHCEAVGGQAAWLEAFALNAGNDAAAYCRAAGSARYLVHLIRDLPADAGAGRCWLPLDIQARYRINRDNMLRSPASDWPVSGWDAAVRDMCRLAATAFDSADRELAGLGRRDAGIAHIHIQSALARRLLRQLARRPSVILQRRVRVSDWYTLWAAWRVGRRYVSAGVAR